MIGIEQLLAVILVLVGGFYGALSPIYVKKGLTDLRQRKFKNLLIGAFIFGTGLLPLILAMKYSDLSFLYPLTGLSYVWTAMYSAYFLGENINTYTWIGIAFTVSGVLLIGISALGF